jgi:hypothetical protein
MTIHFLGGFGTDAPGWIFVDGKFKPVPGWNPEARLELASALNILKFAATLKQPGLSEPIVKAASTFAQHELSTYVKDGGVIIM